MFEPGIVLSYIELFIVFSCCLQAATGGNPEAQHLLGQLHESGELAQAGVSKDPAKAHALYRCASSHSSSHT